MYGVINSILAVGFFSLLLFPAFYLFKNQRIVRIFTHFIYSTFLTVELISLFYFAITLEPLGKSIFQFSFDQANIILDHYFIFRWYYLALPLPIIIYFVCTKYIHIKKERLWRYILLTTGIISIFLNLEINIENGSFKALTKNKTIYFVRSLINHKKTKTIPFEAHNIHFYQKNTNPNLKNLEYPLYHPNDKENPLGPYFKLKETPPNIVFLIIESLSSSFSGPNADEISYTPFLDSLAEYSLYFDNSLATSERSFAALPSILGSLPHGKAGFTNNSIGYPNNETLATWLFDNGYEGYFHYGGDTKFDYMDLFMDNQGFKNILDRKGFKYKDADLIANPDSIPFGIPDQPFLKSVVDKSKNRKSDAPFLDVYLTLSMHYPYIIENHEHYHSKVKNIILKSDAPKNVKDKHHKYTSELATFLYTDDALKWFFNEQEKKDEHQNTIYVILGDHMMGEIPQNNNIEKYRSTMMIYSPLLKKSKLIKGTNTHLDIAPSFHNLIHKKYNFKALDSVCWLGMPFDTSSTFQNNRNVLFMRNNRTVTDMLHGEFFISNNKLYTIDDRLRLTPIKERKKKDFLTELLETSVLIHDEVVSKNKLIPNSGKSEFLVDMHKELNISKDKEYSSVYNDKLAKPYNELSFEMQLTLEGDWSATNENEINPLLVFAMQRGDSTLTWGTVDLNLEKRAIQEERQINYLIKNNLNLKLLEGDEILIYFWNKALSEHDFKVDISSFTLSAK